jgi:hypothetical protein
MVARGGLYTVFRAAPGAARLTDGCHHKNGAFRHDVHWAGVHHDYNEIRY